MTQQSRTLADVDQKLEDNERFVGCDDEIDKQAVRILDQLWEQLLIQLAPKSGRHEVSLGRDPFASAETRSVGKHLTRFNNGTTISYTFVVCLRIPAHGLESKTTLDLVKHPSGAQDSTGSLADWKFTSAKTGITDLGIGTPRKEEIARAAKIGASVVCNDAFKKAEELGKSQPS